MKLPQGLTTPEIRILQEFRRLETNEMTLEQMGKILHPSKVDSSPGKSLINKGFLDSWDGGDTFVLRESGKEFLARKAEPETAESDRPAE